MKGFVKNKRFIFYLALLGVLCVSSTALALQVDWPDSPGGTSLGSDSTLPVLVQYLYEWGIALGGLAVFIVLIIAGVEYLSSFGNPTTMKDAMDRIQSAFFGLVLLLASWLILNTINPDLTTFRPLIIETPAEAFGACETDLDCEDLGPNYKCTDGFCVTDLESQFKIKACISVTISNAKSNGDSVTLTATSYTATYAAVEIKAGSAISFSALPENCMGYLELYPHTAGIGCTGDKQQIILSANKTQDRAGDTAIRCVQLKEIEGSF